MKENYPVQFEKNKASFLNKLNSNFAFQTNKLRNHLIQYGLKEKKCEVCGNSLWNGKEITLELHHIDGNSTNNLLSNLQILCPNCHAQTPNYKSKNHKTK